MVMDQPFDNGFPEPYAALVATYPGDEVYPPDAFRTEWGPIFHRGRLDGSARVVVIGQDPAAHEAICRRILVGEAGQRLQGFLAKLGVTRSYVAVNTFLYSVYGQRGGARHLNDPGIVQYRHRWFDTLTLNNPVEAFVTLGELATRAYRTWKATPTGAACSAAHANLIHPTFPESASAAGMMKRTAAFGALCRSWNAGLATLREVVTPDDPSSAGGTYGTTITTADLRPIPPHDLPAGLPAWMGSLDAWAARSGRDSHTKRATITVTVPKPARTWPTPPPPPTPPQVSR
jgi:hypothetical protein